MSKDDISRVECKLDKLDSRQRRLEIALAFVAGRMLLELIGVLV